MRSTDFTEKNTCVESSCAPPKTLSMLSIEVTCDYILEVNQESHIELLTVDQSIFFP